MKKRILSMLLTIVMLLGLMPMSVFAAEPEVVKSYEVATLYDDGTLEVFGDLSRLATVPWQNDRTLIQKVVFKVDTPLYTRLFSECSNLVEITLPSTITEVPQGCFNNCTSLTSITIPDSVISIGERAFSDCIKLSSITFGASSQLQTIGTHAFNDCDVLTSIAIPDTVTSIGGSAFNSCDTLANIVIPDSVTSINNGAFSSCKALASIAIPDSVTSIDERTFFGCDALTSVTIPDSVTSIGESAFYDCDSLASITIPNLVASIGELAFYGCNVLTDIYYEGTVESWNSISKGDGAIPNSVKINHTDSCVDDDTNHVCDLCGTELTHAYSDEWKFNGNSHWHECSCGAKANEDAHSFDGDTDAGCNICGYSRTIVPVHVHALGWKYNENSHWQECADPSCPKLEDSRTAAENHSGGAATCTEKATCSVCSQPYGELAAHSFSTDWTYDSNTHWHAATCGHEVVSDTAEHSYGSDRTCDTCGYTKPAPYIPPSAPTWRPDVDCGENGDVTVTPRYPEKGDTVIITPEPDKGYEVDEIIVTDRNGESVTVTDKGDGTYRFKQPYGKVTITVTFKKEVCDGGVDCPTASFTDLDSDAWYHEAIDYALENDMMSGYPGNLFGPNDSITRGQIVTILHRLEDAPVVDYLMTYEDVAQEKYYAEAIRWATSEGIVAGYGNDSFGPDDPITRQQLATILWRYSQHKGYDVSVGENTNILSYEDAFDISEYAIPAMQWACGAGVMGGYGNGYLGPNDGATRAQAAQMLKNFMEKAAK